MDNLHLFELINAPPGLGPVRLMVAKALAQWLVYVVPLALAAAWLRGDHATRRQLLQMLLAIAITMAIAQVVGLARPQPRPFTLHLGAQYLQHAGDPRLPSDHVTLLWSLALSALTTHRFAVWGFPLLAAGLVVGWSRVYLGVHFPYDVFAAFPVSLAGAVAAFVLREPAEPAIGLILSLYDRVGQRVRARLRPARKA